MPQEVLQVTQSIERMSQNLQSIGPQFQNVINQITQSLQPLVGQLNQLHQLISGFAAVGGGPSAHQRSASPFVATSSVANNDFLQATRLSQLPSVEYQQIRDRASGVVSIRGVTPSIDDHAISVLDGAARLGQKKAEAEKRLEAANILQHSKYGTVIRKFKSATPQELSTGEFSGIPKEELSRASIDLLQAQSLESRGAQQHIVEIMNLRRVLSQMPVDQHGRHDLKQVAERLLKERGGDPSGLLEALDWAASPFAKSDIGVFQSAAGRVVDPSVFSAELSIAGSLRPYVQSIAENNLKAEAESVRESPRQAQPYDYLSAVPIYSTSERFEAQKAVALGHGQHLQYDITDAPALISAAHKQMGPELDSLVRGLKEAFQKDPAQNALSGVFVSKIEALTDRIKVLTSTFESQTRDIADILQKTGGDLSRLTETERQKLQTVTIQHKQTAKELDDVTEELKRVRKSGRGAPGGGGEDGGGGGEPGIMERVAYQARAASQAVAVIGGAAVAGYTGLEGATRALYGSMIGSETGAITDLFRIKAIEESQRLEQYEAFDAGKMIKQYGDLLLPGRTLYQGRSGYERALRAVEQDIYTEMKAEEAAYNMAKVSGAFGATAGTANILAGALTAFGRGGAAGRAAGGVAGSEAAIGTMAVAAGVKQTADSLEALAHSVANNRYSRLQGGLADTRFGREILGAEASEIVSVAQQRRTAIEYELRRHREALMLREAELESLMPERMGFQSRLDFVRVRQRGAEMLGMYAISEKGLMHGLYGDYAKTAHFPGQIPPQISKPDDQAIRDFQASSQQERIDSLTRRVIGIRKQAVRGGAEPVGVGATMLKSVFTGTTASAVFMGAVGGALIGGLKGTVGGIPGMVAGGIIGAAAGTALSYAESDRVQPFWDKMADVYWKYGNLDTVKVHEQARKRVLDRFAQEQEALVKQQKVDLLNDQLNRQYSGFGKSVELAFRNKEAAGKYANLTGLPVSGAITSAFGYRTHPITHQENSFHNGIDIAAKAGTPFVSVKPGEIIDIGYNNVAGNYIRVKHTDGTITGYAHAERILGKIGDRVAANTVIGHVGSTGMSTRPHLHYTMRNAAGEYVDPLNRFVRLPVSPGAVPAESDIFVPDYRLRETLASERGMTPNQYAIHAQGLASVMGTRAIRPTGGTVADILLRSAGVRRVGISADEVLAQTGRMIDIGRSGLGTFQQLLGNVAELNRISGGQENLRQLENILASAVEAGFNKSRVAQEFARATASLAETMNVTRVDQVATLVASGAKILGAETGVADERGLRQTAEGIAQFSGWVSQRGGQLEAIRLQRMLESGASIYGASVLKGASPQVISEALKEIELIEKGGLKEFTNAQMRVFLSTFSGTPKEKLAAARRVLQAHERADLTTTDIWYEHYQKQSADAAFAAVRRLQQEGKTEEAEAALQKLQTDYIAAATTGTQLDIRGATAAFLYKAGQANILTPASKAGLEAQIAGGRAAYYDAGEVRLAKYTGDLMAKAFAGAKLGNDINSIRQFYSEFLREGGPAETIVTPKTGAQGVALTHERFMRALSGKDPQITVQDIQRHFKDLDRMHFVRTIEAVQSQEAQKVTIANVGQLSKAIVDAIRGVLASSKHAGTSGQLGRDKQ